MALCGPAQPLSPASLTGARVRSALFSLTDESEISHIELADWADVTLVAPATANTLAKLAWCLDHEQHEVTLDEEVRCRAELSLRRMLDLSGGWSPASEAETALELAGVRPRGCGCA